VLVAEFATVPEYRETRVNGLLCKGTFLIEVGRYAEAFGPCQGALANQHNLANDFPAVKAYSARYYQMRDQLFNLIQRHVDLATARLAAARVGVPASGNPFTMLVFLAAVETRWRDARRCLDEVGPYRRVDPKRRGS
jgi:hypothetical protein